MIERPRRIIIILLCTHIGTYAHVKNITIIYTYMLYYVCVIYDFSPSFSGKRASITMLLWPSYNVPVGVVRPLAGILHTRLRYPLYYYNNFFFLRSRIIVILYHKPSRVYEFKIKKKIVLSIVECRSKQNGDVYVCRYVRRLYALRPGIMDY